MQLQLPGQFIGRKAHPISRHGLMVLFTGIAATPRLSDPRMDIGIDDALFNELIIITRQFSLLRRSLIMNFLPQLVNDKTDPQKQGPVWHRNNGTANTARKGCTDGPLSTKSHSRKAHCPHRFLREKPPVHRS